MRDENVVTNLEIIQKINIFVDLICSRNNKNPLNNKEIKMIDQMIDETIQYIY
jgi:hypothetical protein